MSYHDSRRLGLVMLVIAWIIILATLGVIFYQVLQKQNNPNEHPQTITTERYREVVLQANRDNHYVVSGFINEYPVTFLVYTGATQVAVGYQLAKKLGLKPGLQGYAQTANGIVRTAQTQVDRLTIGHIQLSQVSAMITYSETGNAVLLGMSALKKVELVHKSGQLLIRQPLAQLPEITTSSHQE